MYFYVTENQLWLGYSTNKLRFSHSSSNFWAVLLFSKCLGKPLNYMKNDADSFDVVVRANK